MSDERADSEGVREESRFRAALDAFDRANAEDPRAEIDSHGIEQPKELLYAKRMSEMLHEFEPGAPEELQLAARSQHIRRWEISRSSYPMDRIGYKRWRAALATYHAERAGEILRESGYDEKEIGRVQDIVRKRRLKKDAEVQTLEDVVCLVFLRHYLEDFAKQHEDEKVVEILRKTWLKMSGRGREKALRLDLPERSRRLLSLALSI